MNKLFVSISILLAGYTAEAGPRVVGNGGISVVCRHSQTQQITSAYLLDLFEADGWGRTVERSSENPELQLRSALAQLDATPGVQHEVLSTILKIKSQTRFLQDPRVGLPLTDDALPQLRLKNCQYEQLAIYDSDSSTLTIDGEIFNHLSPTDMAALWIHEGTYKLDRLLNDAQTSTAARRLTSLLFTENSQENILQEYNAAFRRYVIKPGQKVLWMDGTKNYSVDLTASNVPVGTTCSIPVLSTGEARWTQEEGRAFYPSLNSLTAPWKNRMGPWANGSVSSSLVTCRTNSLNHRMDVVKSQIQLTIREESDVVMTIVLSDFKMSTVTHFINASTQVDGTAESQFTIRYR